jgi:hypothetical protein
MIKLAPLAREWTKYSVPHDDPTAVKNRKWLDSEPWRGPHLDAELALMLQGRKPVTSISTDEKYNQFLPYIKQGRFVAKKTDYDSWIIAQPKEAWRIDKIITLVRNMRSTRDDEKPTKLYHAKLGLLFGYSKEDIKRFLNVQ